jgi:hypothetical protein
VQCNSACAPADTGCQKGCLAANPNAIAEAFVLGDCAATQCGGECPGTAPLGDCQRCLFTSCAAQMNDCLGNADCFDLLQCVQKCSPGDSGCQQACGFQHFDSIGKAQNIQDCSSAQCAGKCM